jgi:hypothetical protein
MLRVPLLQMLNKVCEAFFLICVYDDTEVLGDHVIVVYKQNIAPAPLRRVSISSRSDYT